jgi:hypothetical protein
VKGEKPYNPLDRIHLGESVRDTLLRRPVMPLPPERFKGAGIYALYYANGFGPYRHLAVINRKKPWSIPIYVGEAVPAGSRKGGVGLGAAPGEVLWRRLCEHAKSIDQARNLNRRDFRCRYLVIEDIWIPLGENMLIEMFQPLWNMFLDGFGNHDPGKGRYNQQRSPWDVVHPGRPWAEKLQPNPRSTATYEKAIEKFLADRLPRE